MEPSDFSDSPGTSEGLEPAEVDLRAELASHVQGSVFPATRSEILASAKSAGAPDDVMSLINGLPSDQTFENMQEVWEAADH